MNEKEIEPELFHTTTSVWSPTVEKVIKDIGESCEGYKWMNIFAAKEASSKYNMLIYTLIVIGPVTGILNTTNANSETLNILITVFSFFSGLLSTIIKFSKFDTKTSSHKAIAAKYASLEANIRRQLSLHRDERVNAGSYLEWVSKSYEDLFASTPLMSNHIYEKWVDFAKINNLNIPKPLGSTIEIEEADHIAKLTTVGEIPIYNHIEVVIQGTGTMKRKPRTEAYNPTVDLNTYTDKSMQYEMARMFGINK